MENMLSSTLPPEILLKILLPGKTLSNLRLVSKQFNSLISDPYLLRLHHHHALNASAILTAFTSFDGSLTVELKLFLFTKPNETSLAVLNARKAFLIDHSKLPYHDSEQPLKPITKRFLGERVRVFSSNHQFLCFVSDKEHLLFNPINQKILEIPQSSSYPPSSPSHISFGFVSSTLQYKLIRFFLPYNPTCKFEILTLTHQETTITISRSRNGNHKKNNVLTLQPFPPVHADGFLYWATKYVPKIEYFSLEQEKFSLFQPPLPCFEANPNHDFSLCGIRGNLWVVDYNSLAPNMEIWKMSGSNSNNGSAWVKTHRIELKETFTRYYPSFPIKIHDIQSDCVIFQVLFPSQIKIYYTNKNEVEDFGELSCQELQLCHYTDGLLSL